MTRYRKLPVEIDAAQYPGHNIETIEELLDFEEWLEPRGKACGRWPMKYRGQSLLIPTLEGEMEAKPGDFIICGVRGELYPCKPDIFRQTYERVE